MSAAMSVVFVREFFEYVPIWIDLPLAILVVVAILIAVVLLLIKLKRYLKAQWLEHEKE